MPVSFGLFIDKILFLTVLFHFCNGDLVVVDKCEDVPLPYLVDIVNCTVPPCPLVRGSNVIVKMDFFTPHYIDDFSPQAKAYVAGIVVNYPLTIQKDGCSYVENTQCPLEPQEYVSYTFIMEVLKLFPKISLGIELSLSDQNNKKFFCFYVNCIVVDQ